MAKKLYGGGTVSKMSNGKWKWRGHYYDETTGKEHRPTKTFNTKKEAEAYCELVFKTDHIKKVLKKSSMTLQQAYEKWQNEVWKVEGNLSDNTIRGYLSIFDGHILPLVGNCSLIDIDIDKIQLYYNSLKKEGKKTKTINNIHCAFNSLIMFCIQKKLINSNPLKQIIIPKGRMKERAAEAVFADAISEDEYSIAKEHLNGVYQYAILFVAESGVRPEELALRHEDVDYEKQVIYIRRATKRETIDFKTHKTRKIESEDLKSVKSYRTLPITPSLLMILQAQEQLLKKYKIKSPYIFPNKAGNIMELRNLTRAWHSACKKSGIEKRGVKCLRKLYITRRVRENIDPKTLQHLVGHESITTTLKYYQILDMEEVANEAVRVDTGLLGLSLPDGTELNTPGFYEE